MDYAGQKNRYLGATCFIDRKHLSVRTKDATAKNSVELRNAIEPAMIMFGGDGGLPYDHFLGDQWILTVQGIYDAYHKNFSMNRTNFCSDLLHPSSRSNYEFQLSCGYLAHIHSKNPCRWEEVVRMAWCLEQYNSFISPF